MLISELKCKEVFSHNGKFIGTVEDALIDLETEDCTRLFLTSLPFLRFLSKNGKLKKQNAKNILSFFKKSFTFKEIESIGDAIILKPKKKVKK